jgi:hypothetical protein
MNKGICMKYTIYLFIFVSTLSILLRAMEQQDSEIVSSNIESLRQELAVLSARVTALERLLGSVPSPNQSSNPISVDAILPRLNHLESFHRGQTVPELSTRQLIGLGLTAFCVVRALTHKK